MFPYSLYHKTLLLQNNVYFFGTLDIAINMFFPVFIIIFWWFEMLWALVKEATIQEHAHVSHQEIWLAKQIWVVRKFQIGGFQQPFEFQFHVRVFAFYLGHDFATLFLRENIHEKPCLSLAK